MTLQSSEPVLSRYVPRAPAKPIMTMIMIIYSGFHEWMPELGPFANGRNCSEMCELSDSMNVRLNSALFERLLASCAVGQWFDTAIIVELEVVFHLMKLILVLA